MTAWPPTAPTPSSNLLTTDTTVIGLITGDDETAAYREEVRALTSWCQDNNLHLNVSKTKELIVDFRRRQREEHAPLSINGTGLRWRESTASGSSGFTSVRTSPGLITLTLSQSQPDSGSFFLHSRLRRLNMDSRILCSFYRCTIESILTGCITAWYSSCTALNRKALQRVVKAAQHITRTELPSMEDLYTQRCRKKATKIIKDPSHHPSYYKLFCLRAVWPTVPQQSIRARTTRLSFIPQAIEAGPLHQPGEGKPPFSGPRTMASDLEVLILIPATSASHSAAKYYPSTR
ncbi:hypothetical protein L3Q82_001187 [Scortum barcoo]|uniref:Uncharacterized protein n=1 Tax=Scortum barcoo TaxID=214431 RepID=A0ACB8W6M7_9TELE|nr:hypothetical protein L3Q82_001187 [Scortum barcoo]